MREIKFRAWDGAQWRCFPLDELIGEHGAWMENHYSDWSEFTGLKDKNDTEIYEGDWVIIRRYQSISISQPLRTAWEIGFIKWADSLPEFLVRVPTSAVDYVGVRFSEIKEIEVIGNIYEDERKLVDGKWMDAAETSRE